MKILPYGSYPVNPSIGSVEGSGGHDVDFDYRVGPDTYQRGGITLREYFAAKALQGILANPSNSNLDLMGVNTDGPLGFIAANMAAKEAVGYADELLKALDNATR